MKIDQTRLDQELDFILGQQRELEDMLLPVEKAIGELSTTSTFQQHADIEREHTYVSLSVCIYHVVGHGCLVVSSLTCPVWAVVVKTAAIAIYRLSTGKFTEANVHDK